MRIRYSLKLAFVLLTVVICFLGYRVHYASLRRQVLAVAVDTGGYVEKTETVAPQWLVGLVGWEYFQGIEETHGLFRKMTDEHLDSISRLTELRHISTNHLGDGSRIALVPPAHGGKMRIVDPLVTDCGLEHLSRLDRLECLILFNTAVTDNGVAQLKHLKNLQQLMIASDAITDESVVHLSAIRSLRRLWICGTSITSQGAGALQRALPNCEVIADTNDRTLP